MVKSPNESMGCCINQLVGVVYLLNEMKRQGNALAAALNNVETIQDVYETAENSAGSAMREQAQYEKGIEYSTERMKASFQELSTTFFSSDFLKMGTDVINGLMNGTTGLLDLFTPGGTIAGIAGLVQSLKGGGKSFIQSYDFSKTYATGDPS